MEEVQTDSTYGRLVAGIAFLERGMSECAKELFNQVGNEVADLQTENKRLKEELQEYKNTYVKP